MLLRSHNISKHKP